MKNAYAICVLSFLTSVSFAQEFEIPQNYAIRKPEDCEQYNNDIIKCIDWLMATPTDQQMDKRMDAGAFIMKWLTETPAVSVEVKQNIVTFMEVNPDLLLIFMGGWTRHVLTTQDTSKVNCNLKGIESVITYYQANKDKLQKDKHVDKYIKMHGDGTLEAFIKKNAY